MAATVNPGDKLKATSNRAVMAGECRAWRCQQRSGHGEFCTYHDERLALTGSTANQCTAPACDRQAERVPSGIGYMLCRSHAMQRYTLGHAGPWQGEAEPHLVPLDGDKVRSGERRGLTPLDRFMLDVSGNPETGCWEWTGYSDPSEHGNYGQFWEGGKRYRAHRWAWEHVAWLELNPELDLDHICRNSACVRPGHLQPVTRRVNGIMATSRNVPPPDGLIYVNPVKHRSIHEWTIGGYYGLPIWQGDEGVIITEYFVDE